MTTISNESIFSSNSEADASELLENVEEMYLGATWVCYTEQKG